MITNNALRQRRSDIDLQSQATSAVAAQLIAPSDQKLDAKRLKLAELQVGLAFIAFVFIGANDGAFGVLIPSLRMHYGVDKATIGLLFLVQSIGYLVAAFTSGLLIEKLGNRRFLMLGVVSLLFGAGALGLMLPFMILLISMLLLGLGIRNH
jgi:fucose permease